MPTKLSVPKVTIPGQTGKRREELDMICPASAGHRRKHYSFAFELINKGGIVVQWCGYCQRNVG